MRQLIIFSILIMFAVLSTACPASNNIPTKNPVPNPVSDIEHDSDNDEVDDPIVSPGGIDVDEGLDTSDEIEPPVSSIQHQPEEVDISMGLTSGEFVEEDVPDLNGWIREWGKSRVSITNGLAKDRNGNLFVLGTFSQKADFEPGGETYEMEAYGENDISISKFNSDGEFMWAKSYGGPANETATDIEIDPSGNLYIIGTFGRTADFDPEPGDENIEPLTAHGRVDCYLLSTNNDGEHRWVKGWGGDNGAVDVTGLTLSGSSPIITGWYAGTIDFNPEEEHGGRGLAGTIARSSSDAYIVFYNSSGRFDRVASWGGETEWDQMMTTGIEVDGGGNVYLAGRFQGRFEVAGTSGLEATIGWHTSRGSEDAFLIKLDNRAYGAWVRTWGGEGADYAHGMTLTSGGNIFVVGGIDETSDLNPLGHTEDIHEVESYGYTFLSKFSSQGVYQWGRSFGDALGVEVATNSSGDAIITGVGQGIVDYDPDRDEEAVYNMEGSVFVNAISNSGDHLWAKAFGRTGRDMGTDIITDSSGNIFVTGMYRGALTWGDENTFVYSSASSDPNAFLLKLTPEGSW